VANGVLECAGWNFVRDGKPDPVLARLFLYYVARVNIENGPADQDTGLQIRDGVTALQTYGAPPESLWPYSDNATQFTVSPTPECYTAAEAHKALFFYRCPDLNTIKASIAQGFPVVFGFTCPNSLQSDETAATGVIQMPLPGEVDNDGHCMVFIGWNDTLQQLEGPNSWGEDWGDKGFFHMPYGYVDQGIVSDCWTIRRVQE
jgi:C1A family cysteine protease